MLVLDFGPRGAEVRGEVEVGDDAAQAVLVLGFGIGFGHVAAAGVGFRWAGEFGGVHVLFSMGGEPLGIFLMRGLFFGGYVQKI